MSIHTHLVLSKPLSNSLQRIKLSHTTTHHADKKIHLISGRCGGNKTGYIVSQIEAKLSENPEQCIIYAAPTKKVLNEVSHSRLTTLDESQKQILVSEEDIKESVASRITKAIEGGYCGCLMITHSALFNLNEALLTDKLVIIDESPEQTIRFSHIEFDADSHPPYFSKFDELTTIGETVASENRSLVTASCADNKTLLLNEGRKLSHISRHNKEKGNTGLANDITAISKLCVAAASEHGFVYFSNVETEHGTKYIYRSIDIGDIIKVVNNASNTWIASADFEYGLLNYILESYHAIPSLQVEGTDIPQTHNNSNVTVLPLLGDDKNWSKTFSESDRAALEGFNYTDVTNYSHDKTVFQELFEFGAHCILAELYENNEGEKSQALMFVNVAKQDECSLDSFIQVSTQSHGQNSYQMHDHAIWMAGLVPNPHEFIALHWFCNDVGIDSEQARERLHHTRQYAPLYQGLARTSLRVEESNIANLFVVPDVSSAKSLLKWIPNATIDTNYLFTLHKLQAKYDETKNKRRALAFELFDALMFVKHGGKQEVYDRFSLDRKQVQRLKEEFYDELNDSNLITDKSDKDLAKEVYNLIHTQGLSERKACVTIGIDKGKYKRIMKKQGGEVEG